MRLADVVLAASPYSQSLARAGLRLPLQVRQHRGRLAGYNACGNNSR